MTYTAEYDFREVKIRCPKCDAVQSAEERFYHGEPWPSYLHECVNCAYIITESEWSYAGEEKP